MHSPVSSPTGSAAEVRGHFPNRRGLQLSFALHCPAAVPAQAQPLQAWLFCNALLEEKTFSHRVGVTLARRLAALGHTVLRFDYAGTGDSESLPDAARGASPCWLDDLADAATLLRTHAPTAGLRLLGVRSGALLAAAAATQLGAGGIVLLEPPLDGHAWLQEGLRANLTTQLSCFKKVVETREQMGARLQSGGTVNVQGHEIDAGFAGLVGGWRLAELLSAAGCPAELVHLSRKEGVAAPTTWQALASGAGVSLHACQAPPMWGESKQHDDEPAALIDLVERLAGAPAARPGSPA